MFKLKFNYLNLIKLFLLLFLTTIIFSHNLIYFFISWVGLNISLYGILLAGRWANNSVTEMTVKYFTVGAMLTVFFLFTMTLYAINYLSFNIDTLSFVFLKNLTENYIFYLNLTQKIFYTTLISLFLFKLGAFPFHFYLNDIYSGLDLHRNMQIYTITLKTLILIAMFNIILQFWFLIEIFYPLLIISAIGSLYISAFSAISQFNFKRFLAFSYLNAIGFVLLGLITGLSYGFGAITFFSAKVYFLSYIVAWGLILLIMRTDGLVLGINKLKQNEGIYYISDLATISIFSNNSKYFFKNIITNFLKKLKIISLVIAFASLMGLPPTIGFFGKTIVYLSLIGSPTGILLLIFSLILTPIMALSYLRILINLLYPNKKFINLSIFELTNTDIFMSIGYGAKLRNNLLLNILILSGIIITYLILIIIFPIFWINLLIY